MREEHPRWGKDKLVVLLRENELGCSASTAGRIIRKLKECGVLIKHFTADDVISRWNVVSVYSRATATTAVNFLDTIDKRMPFSSKSLAPG